MVWEEQIIMANCFEWSLWCFSGPSLFLFIRPFECERLWYLPLFLQTYSSVWVEIFEAASIHFSPLKSSVDWTRRASGHTRYCAWAVNLSTRKEEVSWKECWKYKVSALQQHAKHSWDAAAVLYFKLLLFLRLHSLPLHERLVLATL